MLSNNDNLTYSNILKVAKACFLKKGYVETTIRYIAKEANVSPGTIYSYFKGKKELFDSLDIPEMEQVRPEFNKKRADTLKAALHLFGEKGLEGTTMEEIASAAGISKATLYLFCTSKEDLFAQVLQESDFNTYSKLNITKKENTNWQMTIREIGRRYLKLSTQPERISLLRSIIRESVRYPEIGNLYYEQGFKSACLDVVNYLEFAKASGAPIKNIDLMIAVHTYFCSLQSYILMNSAIVGINMKIKTEEFLEYTTQVFINGISN